MISNRTEPSEPVAYNTAPVRCDFNCNLINDLGDIIIAMQIMAGFEVPQSFCSDDINEDTTVGIAEGIYVLQVVSGLRY